MKNNKGFSFVVLLIIIALLTVGGVIYYFNIRNTDLPSRVDDSNNKIKVSCDSDKIPLMREGEYVAKKISEDIDMDGIKELIVTYEKEVPGWEGVPMPQDRFAFFSCKNNLLVELYNDDLAYSFDLVNYESGKAILINNSEGWYLLIKKGGNYEKLYASNQRLQELKKINVRYLSEDPSRYANVVNNNIVEILKGYQEGDYFSNPTGPEVEITYEYKNNNFEVISVNRWKIVSLNAREFKYPGDWLCRYGLDSNPYECRYKIDVAYNDTFHMYSTGDSKEEFNSISLLAISPKDNQCMEWKQTNKHKLQGCISMDGGKNYAVYTDSKLESVIKSFDLFLKINTLNSH